MTPLPKRKLSTRRQGNREKALKIKVKNAFSCGSCGKLVLPHHVCPKCGFYKGNRVLKIKGKSKEKKANR